MSQPDAALLRDVIQAETDTLVSDLERLGPDDWSRPSPCEGWDVLDVLVHLQVGTTLHTRLVENALAGRVEPPWGAADVQQVGSRLQQLNREARDAGPAANVALLRDRRRGYDAQLARVADDALDRPAWMYGLPATLRLLISTRALEVIVHGSDIRRAVGVEPWFSEAGGRFAGQVGLGYLPFFTSAERLGGAAGTVRQVIDGATTHAVLGPDGLQIVPAEPAPAADADGTRAPATAQATIETDGGTWTLLTWRKLPPAEAERLGRLRIDGDRALVERYLAAIETP